MTEMPPVPLPAKPLDLDGVEEATRNLLVALGQGEKSEVMANTPRRVAELYAETINAPFVDIEAEFKCFPKPANFGAWDVVTVNDAHYVSMCEHHLAPAFGVAHVAYVPGDLIVGYSKLKKGLNYLARQPQLNERILADALDFVTARLRPRWIGMALRSVHCCIANRSNGPAQEIVTVTGFRHDAALDDSAPFEMFDQLRAEFMQTVLSSKPLFLGG